VIDGRPYEAARFRGGANDDHIRLRNTSTSSPVAGVKDSHELTFDIEFRWDGGESAQALASSSQFVLWVVPDPTGTTAHLHGIAWGQAPLVYPPSGQNDQVIERHRWYEVRWKISRENGAQFIEGARWDMRDGMYDELSACVYRPWNVNLSDPGDVWFGTDGQSSAARFNGYMDKVNYFNKLPNKPHTPPSTCTLG